MTALLLVLAIVGSLLLAAFCAGAETAFLSVRRGRVLHMARSGGARAKVIQEALSNLGRTTSALLVGNNLASVAYSSASAALSVVAFPGASSAQSVWSIVAAVVVLFFGEFAPKLLGSARPLRRLLALAPAWRVFAKVFAPVGAAVQGVVCRLMPRRETRERITPATVLKLLHDRKDGVKLSDFESALVARLMVLRSKGEFVTPDSLLSALDDCE